MGETRLVVLDLTEDRHDGHQQPDELERAEHGKVAFRRAVVRRQRRGQRRVRGTVVTGEPRVGDTASAVRVWLVLGHLSDPATRSDDVFGRTAYPGVVNDVSWGALALSLTVLGGIYTWWALRHRGITAAVRGAGLTLLPLAAWMTGLLEVFGEISDSIGHWLTRLVFSPAVWLGMVVFFVAFVLIGGANLVSRRVTPDKPSRRERRAGAKPSTKAVSRTARQDPLIDDEMAEIQAILKKRGIS